MCVLRCSDVCCVCPSLCSPSALPRFSSVSDLAEFIDSKQLIATTCLGITHPLFAKVKFDYCMSYFHIYYQAHQR
jgi:hypothetical protein